MSENRLTIGEMSQLSGISVRMLRFYHEKGLLHPTSVDEQTGYRYYSLDQCASLELIQQMHTLGIPLAQIKEVLERKDALYVLELLEEQLSAIEAKAKRAAIEREVCSSLIADYRICQSKPICDEIMLENLPERKIIRFPHEAGAMYANGITAQQASAELEHNLRAIKQQFIDLEYPMVLFRNVGCIISQEHLLKREYNFSYSYVFVYEFDDEIAEEDLSVFPAGQYVTMYSDGICHSDGTYKALDNISKMLDYIGTKGMTVAGDYFDEVIAELPPIFNKRSEMLYKLYIPVK